MSTEPRRGQRGYVPKKERVALAPGVWVEGFMGLHQLATVEPMVAICGMGFGGILPTYGRAEPGEHTTCFLCAQGGREPEPVVHGPPPDAIDAAEPDPDSARLLVELIRAGEPIATVLFHCQMDDARHLVPVGYTPFSLGFPRDDLACPVCGLRPTREGWRYNFARAADVTVPRLDSERSAP